jgi:hypothetical protein
MLTIRSLCALGALAALTACASLNQLSAEVSSFGEWPAGRSGATYAFDRLPSQQEPAQAQAVQALETAALGALGKAGFKPVAAGAQPDVLVQVGSRSSRERVGPWADPLWWRGGWGYGTYWRAGSPWHGPGWGLHARWDSVRYEREVALLIRDRASGKPLFEARASNDGPTRGDAAIAAAMFDAAMVDFPKTGVNPRRVTVSLGN